MCAEPLIPTPLIAPEVSISFPLDQTSLKTKQEEHQEQAVKLLWSVKSCQNPFYMVYNYRVLSCFNLFPDHAFNLAVTSISFVHPAGDAIPEAKAPYSLDCLMCLKAVVQINKQLQWKEESLSLCINPGGTTIPTCAFYLINPTQRRFAGPWEGLINCI